MPPRVRGKRSQAGKGRAKPVDEGEFDENDAESHLEALSIGPLGASSLTVHNVLASAVLTGTTGLRLDLDRCCLVLGNSYYNAAEFPALRMDVRGRRPGSLFSISLFENGRIQSTGGSEPREAKRAMHKICRRLNQRLDYNFSVQNFDILNILAVYDFRTPINIHRFLTHYRGPNAVDYEPERFPAARLRIPIPKEADGGGAGEAAEAGAGSAGGAGDEAASRASLKLRRLMLAGAAPGVNEEENILDAQIGAGVGTYIIKANSKRLRGAAAARPAPLAEEVVTANVFSTGKTTLTGAKSVASLRFAIEHLKAALADMP